MPKVVSPHWGDAFRIAGDDAAAFRQMVHRVRMAHPYLGGGGHVPVQARTGFRQQGGGAIFPLVAGLHGTAVLDVQQLHAVAHAQDGDIQALEPMSGASASVVLLGPPERMTAPGS